MSGDTVNTPVEYALYALACQHPDLFTEAERFVGGMLAEDQVALRRVRALLRGQERTVDPADVVESLVDDALEDLHRDRTPPNVKRLLDEGISTWAGWPPA